MSAEDTIRPAHASPSAHPPCLHTCVPQAAALTALRARASAARTANSQQRLQGAEAHPARRAGSACAALPASWRLGCRPRQIWAGNPSASPWRQLAEAGWHARKRNPGERAGLWAQQQEVRGTRRHRESPCGSSSPHRRSQGAQRHARPLLPTAVPWGSTAAVAAPHSARLRPSAPLAAPLSMPIKGTNGMEKVVLENAEVCSSHLGPTGGTGLLGPCRPSPAAGRGNSSPLPHVQGSGAEVYLHGAHLCSFTPRGQVGVAEKGRG